MVFAQDNSNMFYKSISKGFECILIVKIATIKRLAFHISLTKKTRCSTKLVIIVKIIPGPPEALRTWLGHGAIK